jgi:cytidylate kinase
MTANNIPFIVAIDGGPGTGTSSLARAVSEQTGWPFLNTGQLYRGVAHAVLAAGVDPDDRVAVTELTRALEFQFDGGEVSHINGEPVAGKLYDGAINLTSSIVAVHPEVRLALDPHQHEFASKTSCVLEGRDIGSHLFPNAQVKIFLTCDDEVRLERMLKAEGRTGSLEEIRAREKLETERKTNPMAAVEDSVVIDTTALTLEEVTEQVLSLIKQRSES